MAKWALRNGGTHSVRDTGLENIDKTQPMAIDDVDHLLIVGEGPVQEFVHHQSFDGRPGVIPALTVDPPPEDVVTGRKPQGSEAIEAACCCQIRPQG